MAGIQANGIGSGLDVNSLVSQLVSAEAAPLQQRIVRHETQVTTKISALGSLKGALSTFKAALDPLKSLSAFQARRATSGDTEFLSVSASSEAISGHYEVEVVHLARAHQLTSNGFDGSDEEIGTGTLTIAVGEDSFDIDVGEDANTLADIRDAINSAADNTGVAATLLTTEEGTHLVLTSSKSGEDYAITVTASGGDGGLSELVYEPGVLTNLAESEPARNALIRIAGYDIESATDVFDDAIEGVTLTAKKASEGADIAIDITFDAASVQARVAKFVTEYNNMQAQFARLGGYNAETKIAGPMVGDSLLRSIESEIRMILSNPVQGARGDYTTLASIGITTTASGALQLDTSKLTEALQEDPDAVAHLFGSEDGVAAQLYSRVDARLTTNGDIDSRNKVLSSELKDIAEDKAALQLRLSQIEARYRKQFTALDTLLAQMQSTSSYLAQQLANLPKIGG